MALFATGTIVTGVATATTFDGNLTGDITGNVTGVGTFTLHVGTRTVLQASEDGTIAWDLAQLLPRSLSTEDLFLQSVL